MAGRSYWRRAIAFSILVHCLIWLTTAYIVSHLQAAPLHQEELVELDVMEAPAEPQAEEPSAATAPSPEPPAMPEEAIAVPAVEDGLEEAKSQPPVVVVKGPPAPGASTGSSKHRGMGTPPIIVYRVYPPSAVGAGFKGIITLKVQILETGVPGNIEVAVTSGSKRLDDAAIATAREWRFIPAKDHEGKPMTCVTIMSISFNRKP